MYGDLEKEKLEQVISFFLYTLLGSVLMLLGILYIFSKTGTTDYEVLLTTLFTAKEQNFMASFFMSFATKVPYGSSTYMVT